jgi:hypothetical protein
MNSVRATCAKFAIAVAVVMAAVSLPGARVLAGDLPISGMPVRELEDFDEAMLNFMNFYGLTAGVLAVSKNGCVVYQRGFGWRTIDPLRVPLPENTPMRVASVEKPLIAATIRKLAAALPGFDLSDFVFDPYLERHGILQIEPWQGLADELLKNITVEHLLLHQGGWDKEFVEFDPMGAEIRIANEMTIFSPPGRINIVRYMLSQPLQFPPGKPHQACNEDANGVCLREPEPCVCDTYSNFGYMVLGLIVEELAGEPATDRMLEHVVTPEMWVPATELFPGRTFMWDQSPREPIYVSDFSELVRNVFFPFYPYWVEAPYGGWDHESQVGCGNMVTSAVPLLAYLDRYRVNGPLTGEPFDGARESWGFAGSANGASSLACQRDDGVNVVVLFNQRIPSAPHLATEMAEIIFGLTETVTWPTSCVDGSWVDFGASSPGYGGYNDPFPSMSAAVSGTAAGTKLHVKPGVSSWTGTLSMRMQLDAPEGIATIGQ